MEIISFYASCLTFDGIMMANLVPIRMIKLMPLTKFVIVTDIASIFNSILKYLIPLNPMNDSQPGNCIEGQRIPVD